MQETANQQKRITLKTIHQMLDGMSVELAEKVHLLFMANYIDYSDCMISAVNESMWNALWNGVWSHLLKPSTI